MGLSCDEDDSAICGNGFFQKTSIYNKRNVEASNNIKIVEILNLVTAILSIVFFFFYRKYQYKIYSLMDKSQHTQDDYTIFV